jgi:hypothetical protein
MRAGALAAWLAQAPADAPTGIRRPERILATKPSAEAKSRREIDTAEPIGRRLRVLVDSEVARGDEELIRESILCDARPTLVVWHHGAMGHLVRGFPIANATEVPHHWPDERFDLVWVLSRAAAEPEYSFASVDQALLDGDILPSD